MTLRLGPVRREASVAASRTRAFAAFTDQIGAWWPRTSSAFGGALAFSDGQLAEQGEGEGHIWGEVITWNPPAALAMTWCHPTHADDQRTQVDIRFVADGAHASIVRLVHSGWDRVPGAAGLVKLYGGDRGWRAVLAAFATAVAGGLARGRPDM
jgi:uncharacterized protein YndB with AHSA1/START domain